MEEKKKIRRPRMRQLKSLISECIQQMDALAADESQLPRVRAAAVMQKASLLQSMFVAQSEERKVKIKCGVDDEPQEPKKAQPKAETLDERLARLKGER
jgi:hypothetical protein